MRTFNLLLGNSDGLLNDLLEDLVRELWQDYGTIRCTRSRTVDEFVLQALRGQFDLAMLPASNPTQPQGPGAPDRIERVEFAIRTIKAVAPVAVVALTGFEEQSKPRLLLYDRV